MFSDKNVMFVLIWLLGAYIWFSEHEDTVNSMSGVFSKFCEKYHLFVSSAGGLNFFFMYGFFFLFGFSFGTINDFLFIMCLLGCVFKYKFFVTLNGFVCCAVTI